MKNFKYFILFLSLITIFEMTNSKDANADACTVTNGVYSETEIKNGCEATPDFYEIVIYKMYLCTIAPTIPTTSATVDLTNCSQVFNSAAGSTTNVSQGASVDLTGTYTRPPTGTYTHGYAMMDNTFGITASIQIDGAMTGQAGGTGVYCRTVAGSGNHTSSGSHDDESICSATEVTAGKYTETLTHFGGAGEPWERIAEADNINGTTASIKGILVDTNGHLAANEGEVDKLEGLVSFANAINVTSDTTFLTMSFNLGEGMSLNRAGADVIYIGSGPFQAIMTAN
jgi:hypothetical protein